jgi:hypothetical protein
VLVERPHLDRPTRVPLATLAHLRGQLFLWLFSRWLLRPRLPVE